VSGKLAHGFSHCVRGTLAIDQGEAENQVALKHEWCKARGVAYMVHVDLLLREFS
jgi:hypothetical protein